VLASSDEEFWFFVDSKGQVISRNADLKTSCRSEEEAMHEGRGFVSRTGEWFFAERMQAIEPE